MLSRLGAKNLNTALKGMRVKLKDMCVKLRKLLKRRRRNTEQPRAKTLGLVEINTSALGETGLKIIRRFKMRYLFCFAPSDSM